MGTNRPRATRSAPSHPIQYVDRQSTDRPCQFPVPTPECRAPGRLEPSSNPAVVHYRYLRYKGKAAKAAELERVKGVEFARTLTAFKQMRNDELSDQLKIWKLIEKNATVKKTTGEP